MTRRDRTKSDITERLESMGIVDEPELAESLLQAFLESAESLRNELSVSLESGDHLRSRNAAHTLKGSTRNLNANALADLCVVVEAESSDGAVKDAAESLAGLEAELATVTDIVHELIREIQGS